MPFDPHVIHPEEPPLDPAGELQLPDDLAELASQLGEDSKFLAGIYPARADFITASCASETAPRGEIASELESLASVQSACDFAKELPPREHIQRSSRKLFRAVALVASLTALIATTPLWFSRNDATPARNIATNLETTSPAVLELPVIPPDEAEPVAAQLPAAPVPPAAAAPAPASRDAFLQDYSGPELEGLYDLIGEEEEDKISI